HVGRSHSKRAITGFHRRPGAFFQAQFRVSSRAGRTRTAGGVALAIVAGRTAQELVYGQAERFAFDVPQCQVERAERVRLLASRRVEPGDVRFLPDRFDLEGILADQASRTLLERIFRTAFTDAGDPDVGLDGDDHVALIEKRIEVRRAIDTYAGNLSLGQRGEQFCRAHQGDGRCCDE